MAWDSKAARRRQSSAASGTRSIAIHARQQSRRVAQPRSQHVADPFLQDFLSPSFDAASYLNATLPPLQTSSRTSGSQGSAREAVPLAELSIQTQELLSQLNAHTTRLTNTLTELTNDILRSGSRLAYEVELLRGETLSLAEALSDGLEHDISRFVPGGVRDIMAEPKAGVDSHGTSAHQRRKSILMASPGATAGATRAAAEGTAAPAPPEGAAGQAETSSAPSEPPYITQLRTLTLVRSRLESVIKTFGDAMEFVFPPSELSISSSFLSVSAPDADGGGRHSTEEKGQQVLRKLRDEISGLLSGNDGGDPIKGIEDAARRVEELKELATVWKGTAEEKGRTKFVESLAKMVEDRHRELLREVEAQQRQQKQQQQQQQQQQSSGRRDGAGRPQAEASGKAVGGVEVADGPGQAETKGYGAYGLISQLQRLRNGL
ncbi:uncharacterized protein P884DRAFT_256538 [Thermothelomyces heterothallicus CBS 202.75]|uniref:uncharacterized protein n=1 Tax=Thermothelomyces heterothallicus CBS 202.75 TaxID=1149848 RepID=UPI0037447371